MNLICRWLKTSAVRFRLFAAALALLVAGCLVLGLSSRSLSTATNAEGRASLPTLANPLSPAPPATVAQSRARSLFYGLPLMFEPNQGQANLDPADPRARFIAHGSGYSLLLGSEGAILNVYAHAPAKPDLSKSNSRSARVESLQMKLAGANPSPSLSGADLLPGKSNYLLGNDPAKWRRGVPQFARVRYDQVYPGIDLVFYGNQGRLEYDFQVAPGADPAQAELEFDGARHLQLKDGALVISDENATLRLEPPRVYQQIGGRQQPVESRFVLRGTNRAGFAIGAYDRSRQLVIDPELLFATYFGGTGDELNTSVAVDTSGNMYLAGSTNSLNLATTGVFQPMLNPAPNARNVYVAEITPPLGSNSAVLDYVTYLGGSGTDYPVGIRADAAGNAYIAGTTTSPDFPTTQTGYQTKPEVAGTHAFVSELNGAAIAAPASELMYSSYLSGNGTDIASGMTIDSNQDIYVTGTTTSNDVASITDQFPASTTPQGQAFQFNRRGPIQFFVTKVDTLAAGIGSILYSTYFGGGVAYTATPIAIGGGIAVDENGNVYFTGTTNYVYTGQSPTTDFPILNAYQPCLDLAPPTFIVGTPTCTNLSSTNSSNPDAFVAKLNWTTLTPPVPPGEQLLWSTYLGGSQSDSGNGIALDTGAANVYVTGTTNSPDFVSSSTLSQIASFQKCLNNVTPTPPIGTVTCASQPATPPLNDAYVARLSNPTASSTGAATNVSLTYFSYLGGQNDEAGLAITVDNASGALITGSTQSPTAQTTASPTPPAGSFPVFPYPSPIQSQLNGTQDAFIARLNTAAAITGQTTVASWAAYYGGSTPDAGNTQALGEGTGIALDVNNNLYLAGDTNVTDLLTNKPLQPQNNGGYDAFAAQIGTAASLSISGVLTLGTNQTYISAGNPATFTYTLTNSGPDLATNITITDTITPAVTQVPLTFVSASATSGTCSGGSTSYIVTCNIQSLQAGSTATITIVLTPAANSSGSSAQFNGGSIQATATNGINIATTSVPAQMSDFTINASPIDVSVPVAGDTATYQVQIIPHPAYSGSISLSVSIPAGLTATTQTFTTPTVTLQGTSPATTTLNVTTTARPILTPVTSLWTRHFYALFFAPGLALLGLGCDRRRRRVVGILLLCMVFALILLQPACSHTSTPPPVAGTPAGTYTLTIAATSGSDTKNATVVLTVP